MIAIPLNKLTRSARNVRKSGGDSIDDLATSILVHGLIHNLTVVDQQADNGENSGKYEVVAGGRRFAALQRLAKQKKVPKTFAVPCHVVDLSGAKYGRSTGLSGMSPCNRSRTGNECTCQSESVSLAERWFARSKDISKT
jgi:ParB-like chromosome segregation protein Spo0J